MYFLKHIQKNFACIAYFTEGQNPEKLSFSEKPTSWEEKPADAENLSKRATNLSYNIERTLWNASKVEEGIKNPENTQTDEINWTEINKTWDGIENTIKGENEKNISLEWRKDLWEQEKAFTPEQQKIIDALEKGDLDINSIEAQELAKEFWMERIFKEAWIDADTGNENLEEAFIESTPEELEWAMRDAQNQQKQMDTKAQEFPVGSPQRQAYERRSSFLWGLIGSLQNAQNGNPTLPEAVWGDVMTNAMRYKWIHEKTWEANKFLMGLARDARTTPWCAGFVSYVLAESGYNITPTLSSKAFIGEGGSWHVAFYMGNGQMLWGNQSDSVSIASIRKPIAGWTTPEELEAKRPPHKDGGTPPVGAIIVFNRGSSDRNMA